MKLTFFNSKRNKEFYKVLEEQFGTSEKLPLILAISDNDDVYASCEDVKKVALSDLHLHTSGMYIGEFRKDGFRPSIEGSAIIPATKNILEVNSKIARMWMYGLDIPCSEDVSGWVIIKCGRDFLGSGRYKEGKILNHVPKGRRIHE